MKTKIEREILMTPVGLALYIQFECFVNGKPFSSHKKKTYFDLMTITKEHHQKHTGNVYFFRISYCGNYISLSTFQNTNFLPRHIFL